jgi:hypothetical protein
VVFSPNWIEDSPAQFTRLHEFFRNTGPTLYFVPLTQLATILVWVLWWRNRDDDVKRDYRRAGVSALLSTAWYLFSAFRKLDRKPVRPADPQRRTEGL